jgi:hypothetical protein
MSMARLWRDQGKPQQARELLAPVYGWFTEGFDMLDPKEAKSLLDVFGVSLLFLSTKVVTVGCCARSDIEETKP